MPKYLLLALPRRPAAPPSVPAARPVGPGGRGALRVPATHVAEQLGRTASTSRAHAGPDLGVVTAARTPRRSPPTARCPRPMTWWRAAVHGRVDSLERALEVAAYISSEPGPGGGPLYEWIDVREIMSGSSSED